MEHIQLTNWTAPTFPVGPGAFQFAPPETDDAKIANLIHSQLGNVHRFTLRVRPIRPVRFDAVVVCYEDPTSGNEIERRMEPLSFPDGQPTYNLWTYVENDPTVRCGTEYRYRFVVRYETVFLRKDPPYFERGEAHEAHLPDAFFDGLPLRAELGWWISRAAMTDMSRLSPSPLRRVDTVHPAMIPVARKFSATVRFNRGEVVATACIDGEAPFEIGDLTTSGVFEAGHGRQLLVYQNYPYTITLTNFRGAPLQVTSFGLADPPPAGTEPQAFEIVTPELPRILACSEEIACHIVARYAPYTCVVRIGTNEGTFDLLVSSMALSG